MSGFKFKRADESPKYAFTAPAASNIVIHSPDGRQAIIEFGGPAVTYAGDLPVEESARIFFEHCLGLVTEAAYRRLKDGM
jgi:hypothetical protein